MYSNSECMYKMAALLVALVAKTWQRQQRSGVRERSWLRSNGIVCLSSFSQPTMVTFNKASFSLLNPGNRNNYFVPEIPNAPSNQQTILQVLWRICISSLLPVCQHHHHHSFSNFLPENQTNAYVILWMDGWIEGAKGKVYFSLFPPQCSRSSLFSRLIKQLLFQFILQQREEKKTCLVAAVFIIFWLPFTSLLVTWMLILIIVIKNTKFSFVCAFSLL